MAGRSPQPAPDGQTDRYGAPFDPGRALQTRIRKRRRIAFVTSLLLGLLLTLLAMGASVIENALRADLLKAGVDRTVVARGLLSQRDADAFAHGTIDYVSGASDVWEPSVTVAGLRLSVPDTFRSHMAEVRGWVAGAKRFLIGGAAALLLLLVYILTGNRSGRRPFSVGGYIAGIGIPLLLALGVGLWGMLDFESLWMWVHRLLIPGGIFPAGEQIMQLFPVELFGGYLEPVALTFVLYGGAVLLLPLILRRLFREPTAGAGKNAGEANRLQNKQRRGY